MVGAVQGSGAALLSSVPTEVLSRPPLTLTPALRPTDWPALVTSGRAAGARRAWAGARARPPQPPPPLLQSCSRKHRGVARHWSRQLHLLHLGTKESPMEAAVPVMGLSCQ